MRRTIASTDEHLTRGISSGPRADRAAASLPLSLPASLQVALAATEVDRCESPHTLPAFALLSRHQAEFQAMAICLRALAHFRSSEPLAQWRARSRMYHCSFAYSRAP